VRRDREGRTPRNRAAFVVQALAAVLAGCGDGTPPADPNTRRREALTRKLQTGSIIERRRAVRALGALGGSRAVAPLAAALADTAPAVRMTAAEALAALGPAAWPALTAALDANDTSAREAAAYGLGRLGDARAAERLREAVADPAPEVRAAAIEALGSLGDRASCPALLPLLGAPDPRVRRAAVHALGRIADPASARQVVAALAARKSKVREPARAALRKMGASALPAIAEALHSTEHGVPTVAMDLIVAIGGPTAFEVLAGAMKDQRIDARHHDRIVSLLVDRHGEAGADRLAEALLPALTSPNDRARANAARYLARQGDARAMPALLAAFRANPTDADVIEALAELKDPRAGAPLLAAYRDPQNKARGAIAAALGEIGYEPAGAVIVEELSRRWTRREDKDERRIIASLCEAAGKLRRSEAVDLLMEATAFHRDNYAGQFIRAAASRALGRIGDVRAIPALAACAADGENRPQAAACDALGMLRDPRSVPPLLEALKDRSRDVRGAAAEALVALGPLALPPLLDRMGDKDGHHRAAIVGVLTRMQPPPLAALAGKLKTGTPAARQSAAWALGTLKAEGTLDDLVAALQDRDATVRAAAVWALRETSDPRAAKPLIEALRDEAPRVRAEAAGTLGSLGETGAVPAILALLEDPAGEVRTAAAAALGNLGDARAVEPLRTLAQTESDGLDKLLADLTRQGKLTDTGRIVPGRPMSDGEKRAILRHRNVRSAANLALRKLVPGGATTQTAR